MLGFIGRLESGGWSGVGGVWVGVGGMKLVWRDLSHGVGVGEVRGVRGVGVEGVEGVRVEKLGWDWGGRRGWRVEVGALGSGRRIWDQWLGSGG